MEQFVVPQFIEVEDKIFGPITTRQFLILLGAGLLIFLAFRFLAFWFFVGCFVLIGGIAVIFAFLKVNGQTFHYFVLNAVQSLAKPRIRIWNKSYSKNELEYLRKFGIEKELEVELKKKPASRRHIRDLSLVVNTGGYYNSEE